MKYEKDLKAFVDGELPPAQMAEIADAVAKDPALQREVAELRLLSASLRPANVPAPAEGLEATLRALGRAKRPPVWSRIAPLATAFAVAALLWIPVRARLVAGESSDQHSEAVVASSFEAPREESAESFAARAMPDAVQEKRAMASVPTENAPLIGGLEKDRVPSLGRKPEAAMRSRPADRAKEKSGGVQEAGTKETVSNDREKSVARPNPNLTDSRADAPPEGERKQATETGTADVNRDAAEPASVATSVALTQAETPEIIVIEVEPGTTQDAERAVRELLQKEFAVVLPEKGERLSFDSGERRLQVRVAQDRISSLGKQTKEAVANAISEAKTRGAVESADARSTKSGAFGGAAGRGIPGSGGAAPGAKKIVGEGESVKMRDVVIVIRPKAKPGGEPPF
jgi:hypothetical protein